MPRPKKCRRVKFVPEINYFVPSPPQLISKEVTLTMEEIEAIRLCDLMSTSQQQGCEEMNVSRGTFQRIINLAHQKIADALVNGKAIRISGGQYTNGECGFKCNNCSCKKSVAKQNTVKKGDLL